MASLSEALGFFDTKLRNTRLDLSARNEAHKTVVLALWRDRLDYSKPPAVSYRLRRTGTEVPDWIDMPDNRVRLADLQWAREHCDGCFRVVIIEATDPAAEPRVITGASPQQMMVMKITELDEETGEFTAAGERIVLPPRPAAMGDVPTKTKPKARKQRLLARAPKSSGPMGRAVVLLDRSVGLSLTQCGHDGTIYSITITSSARARIDGVIVRPSAA
jgi:hypothetical protein